MLLTTNEIRSGILECRLNLNELYPDKDERARFEARWSDFCRSGETDPYVYSPIESNRLTYLSESIIPTKTDNRPPLLLLLGNPATHSVASGMFFAFEGAHDAHREHHEHRFWIGLRKAGLLDFGDVTASRVYLPDDHNNLLRKQRLFDLDYDTPFRIGIAVFYTLPSPASGGQWSGVSGLRRLFGRKGIDQIAEAEQQRIAQIVKDFMPRNGGMMAFQRDAYDAVRSDDAPLYSFDLVKAGKLHGHYQNSPNVQVLGVAPTRFMLSGTVHDALVRYKAYLEVALRE